MSPTPKHSDVRFLKAAEEASLQAQIVGDPDSREATDEDLAQMRPASEALPTALFKALTKRGRPKAENKHVQVTLRIDPDVLGTYKATGPGWQTRMNQALARAASRLKLARPSVDEVTRENTEPRVPVLESEREFSRPLPTPGSRIASKPKTPKVGA